MMSSNILTEFNQIVVAFRFQSNWFQLKSSTMNQTKMHSYFWPYALRGSVTLIIENVNLETFEKIIYRNLKQSIAKIVRKYCSFDVKNCLSEDSDAIR